jgi:hypothetical protein
MSEERFRPQSLNSHLYLPNIDIAAEDIERPQNLVKSSITLENSPS